MYENRFLQAVHDFHGAKIRFQKYVFDSWQGSWKLKNLRVQEPEFLVIKRGTENFWLVPVLTEL